MSFYIKINMNNLTKIYNFSDEAMMKFYIFTEFKKINKAKGKQQKKIFFLSGPALICTFPKE